MRWILLLVFVTLPVQWVLVPTHAIGQQRLSVLVPLLLAVLVGLGYALTTYRAFLAITWPFVVSMVAITVLWVATALFHNESLHGPFAQVVQLIIFVTLGTALWMALSRRAGLGVLRWVGPVTNVVLLAGLTASMLVNHIDPIEVITRTIASADPSYLENRLFKGALVGFGFEADDLQANVRHEIFAAVLTATCLTSVASQLRPFTSRVALFVNRLSLAVTFLLILVSLSRSVTIAAAIWPVLSLTRSWRARHFTRGQVAGTIAAAVAVGAAFAAGFATVVIDRFTADTGSYDKRGSLLDQAFANISSHILIGGVSTQHASSHNFILDSWLRTGIVGALFALAISIVLVTLFVTLVGRAPADPPWMVPATALLGLVLVRLFTAGGGNLTPVGWVALAVFGACVCRLRNPPLPERSAVPPSRVEQSSPRSSWAMAPARAGAR